MATVGGGY